MSVAEDPKQLFLNMMDDCINSSINLIDDIVLTNFGNDDPEGRVITRKFKLAEVSELTGISQYKIAKAEEAGNLPMPEMEPLGSRSKKMRRAGYTVVEIDRIRKFFNTYPWRKKNEPPVVKSGINGKGGCFKTSTMVHYAQWLSLKGYRVLLIDIDQQAHASMYFGYIAQKHVQRDDTIIPYMVGEKDDLSYALKKTAWPNLDIIPSCLSLQLLEREMSNADLPDDPHLMLRNGIETVMHDYDVILTDGHPDMGLGTINQIFAADELLVICSSEVNDFMSSAQTFMGIKDAIDSLSDGYCPGMRVLLTKVTKGKTSSQQLANYITDSLPSGTVLRNFIYSSDEIGKGQLRMRTIFEQDDDQRSTAAAWTRAKNIYGSVFEEISEKMLYPHWPSKRGNAL